MDSLIERSIFELLGKFPWYGCLVQSFKIVVSRGIDTLGVRFDENGNSVRLTINPDFFAAQSEAKRIGLLIHEASHVDRLHLIRVPMATSNWRLGNIAADMAINCYIADLPDGGYYPKTYRLKNYQSFEYYLARLTDKVDEAKQQRSKSQKPEYTDASDDGDEFMPDGAPSALDESPGDEKLSKRYIGSDDKPIDEHDWENCTLSVSEQAQVIENIMQRAIEKMGLDAGLLPAHVEESLKLLRELKVKKWHKELQKFLGRTVNGYNLERTWARRNRRYGLLEAGSKVSGQKKLAIAFDTSGSMSVSELEQALAETMSMVKTGVGGYLMQFDTQVNAVERLRRNIEYVQVKGRGGTSFADLMSKVDELHCDGLVIFTDGGDADECKPPKTPVLWILTGNGESKYDWGYKATID